jgi:hypothetical protein
MSSWGREFSQQWWCTATILYALRHYHCINDTWYSCTSSDHSVKPRTHIARAPRPSVASDNEAAQTAVHAMQPWRHLEHARQSSQSNSQRGTFQHAKKTDWRWLALRLPPCEGSAGARQVSVSRGRLPRRPRNVRTRLNRNGVLTRRPCDWRLLYTQD